jgi:hypothetical protein
MSLSSDLSKRRAQTVDTLDFAVKPADASRCAAFRDAERLSYFCSHQTVDTHDGLQNNAAA